MGPGRSGAPAVPCLRVRLHPSAQLTIAQTRAVETALPRTSALDADLGALNAEIPKLRRLLLAWWQEHGRHTIPWKRRADGRPATDGEPLDPFAIWIAEVMRAARQHSSRVSPAPLRWTEAVPTPGADCVSGW